MFVSHPNVMPFIVESLLGCFGDEFVMVWSRLLCYCSRLRSESSVAYVIRALLDLQA